MKLKKISYPVFLMGVVLILGLLIPIISYGFRIFMNPTTFIVNNLEVAILLILLYRAKMDNPNPIAIACICFGVLSAISLVRGIPQLFSSDFMDILIYGGLKSCLFSLSKCLMYLILGINLLQKKKMPISYNIIFGIAAFVLLYGSVLMAVARPTAILSELPDFLFIMSIWYTPRLFDESKLHTTAITSKKLKVVVFLIVAMFALVATAGGIADSDSNRKNSAYDPNGFMGYSDDFWDWYYKNQWTK